MVKETKKIKKKFLKKRMSEQSKKRARDDSVMGSELVYKILATCGRGSPMCKTKKWAPCYVYIPNCATYSCLLCPEHYAHINLYNKIGVTAFYQTNKN